MRVLFLSNEYPPYAEGGYERLCHEVACALLARGHAVTVLTSRPRRDAEATETLEPHPGHRAVRALRLELEGGLVHTIVRMMATRARDERHNVRILRKTIDEHRPDVALVWGLWNVPRSVPAELEAAMGTRVGYYVCDYWPAQPSAYVMRWRAAPRRPVMGLLKAALARAFLPRLERETRQPLQLRNVLCVSHATRRGLLEAGVPVERAAIVYGGTPVEPFRSVGRARASRNDDRLRLVTVGRLAPEKGVHTIVEAIAGLPAEARARVSFDIVGSGHPGTRAELAAQIASEGLGGQVTLRGSIPKSKVAAVLAAHDAFVFASTWEEPFARAPLEAMLVGLPVITTTSGGTSELLAHGEIALTVPPNDADAIRRAIERLLDDVPLRERLGRAGRSVVLAHYTFDRTADAIESFLSRIAGAS